eukprot:gene16582-11860_t
MSCGSSTASATLLELPDDVWLCIFGEWLPDAASATRFDAAVCSRALRHRCVSWLRRSPAAFCPSESEAGLPSSDALQRYAHWLQSRRPCAAGLVLELGTWRFLLHDRFRLGTWRFLLHDRFRAPSQPPATTVRAKRRQRPPAEDAFAADDAVAARRAAFLSTVRDVLVVVDACAADAYDGGVRRGDVAFLSRRLHEDEDDGDADGRVAAAELMLRFAEAHCVFPRATSLHLVVRNAEACPWFVLQRFVSERCFPALQALRLHVLSQEQLNWLLFGRYVWADWADDAAFVSDAERACVEANVWRLPPTLRRLRFQRLDVTERNEHEFLCLLQRNGARLAAVAFDASLPGYVPIGDVRAHLRRCPQPPLPALTTLEAGQGCRLARYLWTAFAATLRAALQAAESLRVDAASPFDAADARRDWRRLRGATSLARRVDFAGGRGLLALLFASRDDAADDDAGDAGDGDEAPPLFAGCEALRLAVRHLPRAVAADCAALRRCSFARLRELRVEGVPLAWRGVAALWTALHAATQATSLALDVVCAEADDDADAALFAAALQRTPPLDALRRSGGAAARRRRVSRAGDGDAAAGDADAAQRAAAVAARSDLVALCRGLRALNAIDVGGVAIVDDDDAALVAAGDGLVRRAPDAFVCRRVRRWLRTTPPAACPCGPPA